jgi:hypothetical protein
LRSSDFPCGIFSGDKSARYNKFPSGAGILSDDIVKVNSLTMKIGNDVGKSEVRVISFFTIAICENKNCEKSGDLLRFFPLQRACGVRISDHSYGIDSLARTAFTGLTLTHLLP